MAASAISGQTGPDCAAGIENYGSSPGRRWAVESVGWVGESNLEGEGGGATAAAETTKRLAVSQQAVGRCWNKRGSGAL